MNRNRSGGRETSLLSYRRTILAPLSPWMQMEGTSHRETAQLRDRERNRELEKEGNELHPSLCLYYMWRSMPQVRNDGWE